MAQSPAKLKPKAGLLPGFGSSPNFGSSVVGGYGLPTAMPRQREPSLYVYKLPLVFSTLFAITAVVTSPWPQYHGLLWVLVFFSSCSLMSVVCQAIRMASTVRVYRALYCGSGATLGSAAMGGGGIGGNGSSSSGSGALLAGSGGAGGSSGAGAGGAGGGGSGAGGVAGGSPGKDAAPSGAQERGGGGGGGSGLKVEMASLAAPSRPGHKGHKALRKGHRSSVSVDALDACDQGSLEGVALVIDCEDWSETSGSGTDWTAGPPRWNHVFVIPNYKEDISTLNATLEQLAGHAWASTYSVLLAMESKEAGATAKAAALQEQFGCCFHSVVHTLHVLDAAEMPGKASNVNAAVRQFYAMVTGDRSSYMLTVMDADALVPFEYVQQLESASAAAQNPGGHVYAAPVLFEQDASGVPGIVRATDYMWSALAAQNLNSWFGIGFPISNYSVSLKLAHDVGYWDTFPDAIGEDMHMFIKAFLRTNGATRLVPLHAPVNMCHIQGPNYVRSLWARFTQAERHMRGIADTAYVMHEWGRASFSLRKLVMFVACLEAHLIPVVTLTSLVILPVFYNLHMLLTTHAVPSPSTLPLPMRVLAALGQGNLLFVVFILGCYEVIRGIVRRHVYRLLDNDKHERCWWWCPRYALHCLNYLTLFVSVWIYTVVPVVVVVGKHMLNHRSMNYVVAEKRAAVHAAL